MPEAPTRIELPSGLIIEDIKVGEGRDCPPGATVTIHYRGMLDDGTEFDSSYRRGGPATFPLPQLIKGWQEGIPGMKVGGQRRLIIPHHLAYGETARPGIPARSRLTFEIELFGVR